jgi:hypothetical protein
MRIGEKTNMPDDELMPVEMLARLLELKKRTSAALGAEPELSKLIDSAIESNKVGIRLTQVDPTDCGLVLALREVGWTIWS